MAIRMDFVTFGLAVVITALPVAAAGTGQFNDLQIKVKQSTHGSQSHLGANLPASDIGAGLKKALAKGTSYVTQKTIDGLFIEIGAEEQSIHTDPGARTTDLLKKVFGGK